MSRFDELRAANPDTGFAIYAIEPGGPVTLELFAAGTVFTFRGASEDDVLDMAFPPEPPAAAVPEDSVFD